jgi:hypothetical protein
MRYALDSLLGPRELSNHRVPAHGRDMLSRVIRSAVLSVRVRVRVKVGLVLGRDILSRVIRSVLSVHEDVIPMSESVSLAVPWLKIAPSLRVVLPNFVQVLPPKNRRTYTIIYFVPSVPPRRRRRCRRRHRRRCSPQIIPLPPHTCLFIYIS